MIGCLRDTEMEAHCCLGVAAEVALRNGFDFRDMDWAYGTMPDSLADWYGFTEGDPLISPDALEPITAIRANDMKGWDFPRIAAAVRETYLPDGDVAE